MEVAIAISAPHQLHHHHIEQLNSRIKGKKSLSLENYLAFLRSRDHHNLTVQHLKQIISIHSFKQLNHRKNLEEAVGAIELIDPIRSTLNDRISSKASITLEETIKDLESLNWQECSVTTIRSTNSLNYAPVPSEIATKSPSPKAKKRSTSTLPTTSLSSESGPKESSSGSGSSSLTQKAKKKTKLATAATSSSTGNNGCGPSKSCSRSGLPTLKSEVVSLVTEGEGGGANAGVAKREMSRNRKSIKRILSTAVVAATDASN